MSEVPLYPKVDTPCLRYQILNFGASKHEIGVADWTWDMHVWSKVTESTWNPTALMFFESVTPCILGVGIGGGGAQSCRGTRCLSNLG